MVTKTNAIEYRIVIEVVVDSGRPVVYYSQYIDKDIDQYDDYMKYFQDFYNGEKTDEFFTMILEDGTRAYFPTTVMQSSVIKIEERPKVPGSKANVGKPSVLLERCDYSSTDNDD
jgi:hypothetical protein